MQKLTTWVTVPENSDFSIYNLPYGIFSTSNRDPRVGVAIGDQIIDLFEASQTGLFDGLGIDSSLFLNEYLNDFISLGKEITNEVRSRLQQTLCDESSPLKDNSSVFTERAHATMHLPVKVGDYTDFYSSIEHATNVGKMFRDPENALLPNWKQLPVGYHGRSSSIVVSGTDIHRPKGQTKPDDGNPVFGPCRLLDFELEMAFVIGKETEMGSSVSTKDAEDHIFGLVLFNDWSARDIQKWEYVPLGPFLGKNFASSVSPWIVPIEAFDPFRTEGPKQEPAVLPYLEYSGSQNYDIDLEVEIIPQGSDQETTISKSNFKYMYWNMAQQLAHHTVNGCNVRVGDMMASGTISGKDETSYGSMLELSWAGSKTITLNDGSERKFLKDGDTVVMKGASVKDDIRVGFGEVRTKILPAD
jgi:fumarylacetoacetase